MIQNFTGKAYVRGYEVEFSRSSNLDVTKLDQLKL